MSDLGKSLILVGVLVALLGVFLVYHDRLTFLKFLGRLPGDIKIERENFAFYFPLATSILVSVVLTLLFALFGGRK